MLPGIMAETKLLPLDMHQLQSCPLLSPARDVIMLADLERTSGVVPLELGALKRTTRRVAALLNNPRAGDFLTPRPRKRVPASMCPVCRALNPRSHMAKACHHVNMPPVPYPSFISERRNNENTTVTSDLDSEEDEGVGSGDDVFDTSVLRQEDDSDVNEFSLPPVFSAAPKKHGRKPRKKRVVPTVSENTFVTSNYKQIEGNIDSVDSEGDWTEESEDSKLPSIHQEGKEESENKKGARKDDKQTRRVRRTRRRREQPELADEQQPADDPDVAVTSHTEPDTLVRTGLDTEKSGASLHIDEDYEPMKVTIKKLTENDVYVRGYSQYQEFTGVLSDSMSGSAFMSRENTKDSYSPTFIRRETTQDSYSPTFIRRETTQDSYSPTFVRRETSIDSYSPNFADRARSASWCQCRQSDGGQCQECRMTGSHERWCVSAGSVCQQCRKPKKVDGRTSGRSSESLAYGSPDPALTTRKLNSVHSQRSQISQQSCSSHHADLKKTNKKRSRGKSNEGEQRVRFSDTVQQVSPDNRKRLPKTALDYDSLENYDHVNNDDDTGNTEEIWADKVEFNPEEVEDSNTKKQKRPKSLDDIRIPELGVNIHRAAYILALKDAQMGLTKKKKKKKGKKGKTLDSSRSDPGTVFSYFPLLPQPTSSRSSKDLNIGLRQNEGAKVKLKNAMKHIFGSVKWDNYYPGGSRWKKMV